MSTDSGPDQIYWLSGNILIERGNKVKAMRALQKAREKMQQDNVSVWLFPEGTRNYGKGLQTFKTGAFHLARHAQLPLVPVVASNYYPGFRLNRLNNGEIIIKFMKPISKEELTAQSVRDIAYTVHERMNAEIATLDKGSDAQWNENSR